MGFNYVNNTDANVDVIVDSVTQAVVGLRNRKTGDETYFPRVIEVTESRALNKYDNGATLDCTTSGLTLTAPAGLVNFGCAIINNTTTIAFSGGVTGNGATTNIELTAAVGAIVPTSTANAYKVVG
jgi:hypothetical protein